MKLACTGSGGACVMPADRVLITRNGARLVCPLHDHADYILPHKAEEPNPEALPEAILRQWAKAERAYQREEEKTLRNIRARAEASRGREARVRAALAGRPVAEGLFSGEVAA